MKKVRLKEGYFYMTVGKIYNVIKEDEYYYTVIDDDEDESEISKNRFEEVKEPNYVMVRDFKNEEWKKRILLHDLGEQFFRRYIVVNIEDETEYLECKSNIIFNGYLQMKPINEVEQKIEELEKKIEELKQQINK